MNDKNNNNYLNYGLALGLVVALGLGVGALVVATGKDDSKTQSDLVGKVLATSLFFSTYPGVVQGDFNDAGYANTGEVDKAGKLISPPKDAKNFFGVISTSVGKLPKYEDIKDDTSRFASFQTVTSVKKILNFVASSANKFAKKAGISTDTLSAKEIVVLRKSSGARETKIILALKLNGKSMDSADKSSNRDQKVEFEITNLLSLFHKLSDKLGVAALGVEGSDYFAAYNLDGFISDEEKQAEKDAKAFGFESKKDFDDYFAFGFDLDRVKDILGNVAGVNAQAVPDSSATALEQTNLILAVNKETGDIKVAYRLLPSVAKEDAKATFVINTVEEIVADTTTKTPKLSEHADITATFENT